MSKLRSVNTHFWNDNYIIDLDPIEKLLFLYLLTNPNTNMLGIYELHIRKISFETGIDKDMVSKIFDRFHESGKASYTSGYVCLHNFTKHQAYNDNMKKSAITSFNELPNDVKKQGFIKELLKALEPLPKGFKPIAEIEYELEVETETEKEEGKSNVPTRPDCFKYFKEIQSTDTEAEKFYDYYQARNWELSGKPVYDWKALARTWVRRDLQTGKEFTYNEMLTECDKKGISTDNFKRLENDVWVRS